MTTLAYSHTLVAGTPENINDVQDMFNDVKTLVNGNLDATNLAATAKPATLMGAYRPVSGEALFSFVNTHTAGTWVASTSSAAVLVGTTSPIAQAIIPITLADYAVSGLTTQFRVQAATITNNAAPAVNFVYSLGLVAGLSGTGGSIGISSVTLNPTNVTRATPGGVTANVDSTADFTVSSSGVYVLCVTLSGTPADNSNTVCALRLQVHNV